MEFCDNSNESNLEESLNFECYTPAGSSRSATPFSFHLEVFDVNSQDLDEESVKEDSSGSDNENGDKSDDSSLQWKTRKNRKRKRDNYSPSKENNNSQSCDLPEVPIDVEEEIERQLAEKASKSNLTVVNVKNILKQVLTNERVLAMVRHTMEETEGLIDDESMEDIPIPKLTRSKAKELFQKQPEMAWPMTPSKWPVPVVSPECQVLIDQELAEDSSDEEYQPNEEDLMNISDFDFEAQPLTPMCSSTPRAPSSLDYSTETIEPSSWAEDGAFQIPPENIGQRTRSKLSLSDTALETIESTLVPPDITTDMYEVDCDDDNWKDFLKQFAEPMKTSVNDTLDDDDEADPEYNLLADEDAEDVDKEELRMDRGVKVSKKELNQLMKELLDMYEDYTPITRSNNRSGGSQHYSDIEEDPPCDDFETLTKELDIPDDLLDDPLCLSELNPEQRLLLDQHMRKHVQLTAQHFVQTYRHPEFSAMAAQCKDQLEFLKMSTGNNTNSAFASANLDLALILVKDWENVMDGPAGSEITQFVNREIQIAKSHRKVKKRYNSRFPPKMMDVVGNSSVIIYPLLLPTIPFRCDGFLTTCIFPSEDHLIAIGMEQFLPYVRERETHFNKKKYHLTDALVLVGKHLLPFYDIGVLIGHVKRQRKSKENKLNPVMYYFQHNKAPGTDHFVVAFDNSMLKHLSLQPPALMPTVWREHFFPGTKLSSVMLPPSTNPKTLRRVLYIPVPM